MTINTKEVDLKTEVMRITEGDGFPRQVSTYTKSFLEIILKFPPFYFFNRLVEASGASNLVNNCFKLLQKVSHSKIPSQFLFI